MKQWQATWWRDPRLHFIAIGVALFAVHAVVSDGDARTPTTEIAIGADVTDPARYVDEEVLYREAVALGLHRRDPIVRRRLIQKMEFLIEGGDAAPTDDQLRAWMAAHPAATEVPATVDFEHEVSAGGPFLRGRTFAHRSRAQVAATFGDGFADAVFALPIGDWADGIESSFGTHRVRVTARHRAAVPPLDDVRARVAADYQSSQRAVNRAAAMTALRRRYTVRR